MEVFPIKYFLMSQTITNQLIAEGKKRGIKSIKQLAAAIGIPHDRIYKWQHGEGNPKSEDVEIIKKWMNVEEVPKKEGEPIQAITDLIKSNQILAEANKKLADAHEIIASGNKELILLTRQAFEFSLGRSPQAELISPPSEVSTAAVDELHHTGRSGPYGLPKKGKTKDNSGQKGK